MSAKITAVREKNSRKNSIIAWTIAMIFALAYLIVSFLPFYFMVLNSFKEQFEMLQKGVFEFPDTFFISNYIDVLQNNFVGYFINSVLVLATSLFLLLMVSSFAAYPLSRYKHKITSGVLAFIVACMAIPVHVTMIPIFKMSQNLGTYDSIWGLVGPYIAVGVPVSVFILSGFMRQIPMEIEEAASIDGCNRYSTFFRIILPLSKPGLATLAIYNGVAMWNEFIFAYTLTQSPESRTLPLAVWDFQGQYTMNTPVIMAILTLSILPMIILFIIFQDKLVKGMTAGAVKG